MRRLLIIGAGGHGAVVAESALSSEQWREIAFLDDRFPSLNDVFGFPVIGVTAALIECLSDDSEFVVAIGDNDVRLRYQSAIESGGGRMATVVDPSAVVSQSSQIGHGSVIMATCVINARSVLGRGVIINTAATIDHDCVLADGVHISPGAHLAGEVRVGERAWIGLGATVNSGTHIGAASIVGASAAVINDIPAGATVVGVPAR